MLENLAQYTGTDNYHRYSPLFRNHVLTDGCKYVADNASAYWLFDAICSYHAKIKTLCKKDPRLIDLQIWKLVAKDNKATLTCWGDTGKNEKPVITQRISYTDLPNVEFKFYVKQLDTKTFCVMLPSEY